jgi:hypothetical protein
MSTPNESTFSSGSPFQNTFKPSHLRFLIFRVLVMFLAYQIGFAVLQRFASGQLAGLTPDISFFYALTFALVYAISLYFSTRQVTEDLCIRISNGCIEGPTGDRRRRRIQFNLGKIDRTRTLRSSWANALFQYRHIWSTDGEKIVLYTHAFSTAQVEALFATMYSAE